MQRVDMLVIVPHEDDELVIAGPMIYQAVKEKMQIRIVFVTNGDYHAHEGAIRIKEAINSLATLGVKREEIIFLGYGDQTGSKHLYNGSEGEILSAHNGNIYTYGMESLDEFAVVEYGVHHSYTRENYKGDIKAVLEKFLPNIVITTDWDDHMDHIALSLMVDECLGELFKEREYEPLVLKAQAYTGKWEGKADYYNGINETQNYNGSFGTESVHPLNKWEERIRFAVPKECNTQFLRNNVLYHAACAYRSQGADIKTLQFINSDIVYWRRHTESMTYRSKITVSSGEEKYLTDFKCIDCSDIVSAYRKYDAGIWIPEAWDQEKKVLIELEKESVIREIHLYENPDDSNNIMNICIEFADGSQIETGELNHDGSCTKILLPDEKSGDKISLKILKAEGNKAGLTEVEIYQNVRPLSSYKIPLSIWSEDKTEETEQRNAIGCKMEKLYFAMIKRCRGRVWPNKYMLMQKYAVLNEADSMLKFWIKHIQFVIDRMLVKMKG